MKLINNSEQFVLQYNSSDYTIPQGEFEVVNDNLGYHILFISNKWGKDVMSVPNSLTPAIKQEPIKIKEEIKVVEKNEEKVETKKVEEKLKVSKK